MKFGVIGIGRVGGSISLYFKEKGIDFLWWTRDKHKRENLKRLIGAPLPSPEKVLEESDLTFICIKDDEIENFVKRLKVKNKGKVVHTSGTLGLDVLSTFEKKGFEIGSFHPIQSFAEMNSGYLKNIYASFVGNEEIYETLKNLFKRDVKILKVQEEQKFLIHLASTISSNFLIFLLRWSEKILERENLKVEILFPLIKETLENVKKSGTKKSLTGPAKRKDFETLAKHERYLNEEFPEFFEIYLAVTRILLKNEIS